MRSRSDIYCNYSRCLTYPGRKSPGIIGNFFSTFKPNENVIVSYSSLAVKSTENSPFSVSFYNHSWEIMVSIEA